MYRSVHGILEHGPIRASAPCRVDAGGTWDIKALALPLARCVPVTVNIALSLRTTVVLSPYTRGLVRIGSEGFSRVESAPVPALPFDPPFGLFFAAVSHFGFHGLDVRIHSDSPVKSALGGSSTALIALIKALSELSLRAGGIRLSRRRMLHLGYDLEDGISGGYCGMQDHIAAVYGGVHLWRWCYGTGGSVFERVSLLDKKGRGELSRRLLVAYSGQSHESARTNRKWVGEFLSGRSRAGWVEVNRTVQRFADAVSARRWEEAAELLREECALRRQLTPEALIPVTETLIDQAAAAGCGARFAGAGAGGSVWALGTVERVSALRHAWSRTLGAIPGAGILECTVDGAGVR